MVLIWVMCAIGTIENMWMQSDRLVLPILSAGALAMLLIQLALLSGTAINKCTVDAPAPSMR